MKHENWKDPSNRVGTISQNSSETPFKLFRFTVGLSHLEKLPFAQASACIASANTKKSNGKYFVPALIRPNFKISETQ